MKNVSHCISIKYFWLVQYPAGYHPGPVVPPRTDGASLLLSFTSEVSEMVPCFMSLVASNLLTDPKNLRCWLLVLWSKDQISYSWRVRFFQEQIIWLQLNENFVKRSGAELTLRFRLLLGSYITVVYSTCLRPKLEIVARSPLYLITDFYVYLCKSIKLHALFSCCHSQQWSSRLHPECSISPLITSILNYWVESINSISI